MFQEIKEKIIQQLGEGDKLASELQFALNVKRSPDFWSAIAQLKQERKINDYLVESPPSAVLAYTLVK